jgi:hypothetical protein
MESCNAAFLAYAAFMKKKHAYQYTIRNVPPEVNAALRKMAAREGTSLNESALTALRDGTAVEERGPALYHDLDELIGTWVDDPEFDKALRMQHVVEKDLWKGSSFRAMRISMSCRNSRGVDASQK